MDNENLLITVRDNGIGISKEVVSKVFDPFFTDKPPGKGTGLGLSIVHDIITRNAGKVSCDSQEGEFAEFKIQLPIQS